MSELVIGRHVLIESAQKLGATSREVDQAICRTVCFLSKKQIGGKAVMLVRSDDCGTQLAIFSRKNCQWCKGKDIEVLSRSEIRGHKKEVYQLLRRLVPSLGENGALNGRVRPQLRKRDPGRWKKKQIRWSRVGGRIAAR